MTWANEFCTTNF